MERIPDEVYEQFLWLLVKYDCPYALIFIADQAHQAGMSATDFLRNLVEKELFKHETQAGTQRTTDE